MKEKSVTFTKGESKFLENKLGEGDFSVEKKLSPETERISCFTNFLSI